MYLRHHHDMRITLTLDEDVAAKLKDEMRHSGKTFKETVNMVLRNGLNIRKKSKAKLFRVHPKEFRPQVTVDYDNIGELIDQSEGSSHR